MGRDRSPGSLKCDSCGERRPPNQFVTGSGGGRYCANCLVKRECNQCGNAVILLESNKNQKDVYCDDCANNQDEKSRTNQLASTIKRWGLVIIGISGYLFLRAFDEFAVIFLKLSDELGQNLRPLIEFLHNIRPVFVPIFGLYQSQIGIQVVIMLGFGSFLLLFLRNISPFKLPVMILITFPGTISHELAHVLTLKFFGYQPVEVTYFQYSRRRLGYVKWRDNLSMFETMGVSAAPLLFNSLLAILIATVATLHQQSLPVWGLVIAYWLAFSLGARALPSHGDIDNIWEYIINHWRGNRLLLFTIPVVFGLRLFQFLKIVYWEIIFSVSLVVLGTVLGDWIGGL